MAMDWQAPLRHQLPEGVKDRLPREAGWVRRLAALWMEQFRLWGYREVVTPAFEFLDTVLSGQGALGRREDYYQLFDRRGRTLALRPDMTAPIARLAATKLGGEPRPLRLAYWGPVFRHRDQKSGSLHEIWQGGIELLGAGGAAADAEVIALACATLQAAGVQGFKIGVGHVQLVEGVLTESGVDAGVAAELRTALAARDLVAYEKAVAGAGLPPEPAQWLADLADFHGGYDEAVTRFGALQNPLVGKALTEIGETMRLVEAYGVGGEVALDLGLARAFGYYTGVIFEGYAPGVGAPVLGGGRYDGLLTDFAPDDPPVPATGFALDVDRTLMALERQGQGAGEPELDVLLVAASGSEGEAMARARDLRRQGKSVEMILNGRTGPDLAAYARARRAGQVVVVAPTGDGDSPPPADTPSETAAGQERRGGRRPAAPGVTPIH